MDNVIFRLRPLLNVPGTQCFEPSAAPAGADEGDSVGDFVIEMPTLVPTATLPAPVSLELPPPYTATPPADVSGEGSG